MAETGKDTTAHERLSRVAHAVARAWTEPEYGLEQSSVESPEFYGHPEIDGDLEDDRLALSPADGYSRNADSPAHVAASASYNLEREREGCQPGRQFDSSGGLAANAYVPNLFAEDITLRQSSAGAKAQEAQEAQEVQEAGEETNRSNSQIPSEEK
ncbi:hypothetical protein QQS21_005499 [Conoideocrella luteorostrata]|uniref:Uncharacterized protein n=1 Tax=Conoideocrella luteorostrata TaxID=1105319 RepID=A0AAJ0CPB4_9HYPO|nr:hypothetical protein QQS21_005499 [Conoideocrella luteorostrata]